MSGKSLEELPSFSIRNLTDHLKRSGWNIGRIISVLERGETAVPAGGVHWSSVGRSLGELLYTFGRDGEGVYTLFWFQWSDRIGDHRGTVRYYFEGRESNLVPGSRHYFWRDKTQDGRLCRKIFMHNGELCSGHVLREKYGLLYGIQKKGHLERYLWVFNRRRTYSFRKYGKKSYRGQPTPGYLRYLYIEEEGERRLCSYLLHRFPV